MDEVLIKSPEKQITLDILRLLAEKPERQLPRRENFEGFCEARAQQYENFTPETYLELPETNADRLRRVNEDQLRNEPMDSNCRAAIVIPAYNEATSITQILTALQFQTSPQEAEVIVVVNNSTDGTAEIAKDYIREHPGRLKIHIVEVDFPPEERGVAAARKLGSDLALFRASQRPGGIGEFYLLGLDADNPKVPETHIQQTIATFRETGADTLAGRTALDLEGFYEKTGEMQILAVAACIEDYPELNAFLQQEIARRDEREKTNPQGFIHTSGANHAITAEMYARVGGYPITLRTGEDIYIGEATRVLKGSVERLEDTIPIDPRRFLLDPGGYISGDAWSEAHFVGANDRIRSGESQFSLNTNEIRLRLTSILDRFAARQASDTKGLSWAQSVAVTRARFLELCEKYGVEEDLRPNNDAYRISEFKLRKMGRKGDIKPYQTNPIRPDILDTFEGEDNPEHYDLFEVARLDNQIYLLRRDPQNIESLDSTHLAWIRVHNPKMKDKSKASMPKIYY